MKRIFIILLLLWFILSCAHINENTNNNGSLSITLYFLPTEAHVDCEISTVKLNNAHDTPFSIPLNKTISLGKKTQMSFKDMPIPSGYYKSIDFDITTIKKADQSNNDNKIDTFIVSKTPFYIKGHSETCLEFDVTCSLEDKEIRINLLDSPKNKKVGLKGQLAYITNEGDNTVSVIDRLSGSVIALIPVGVNPRGIVLDENGTYAYVANAKSNSVSVIDTATKKVEDTIILGLGLEPESIAISPDDEFLVTANRSSDNISIIGTTYRRVIRHVPLRRGPSRVAIKINYNPSKEYWAFVTNRNSSELSIVKWIERDATLEHISPDTLSLKREPVGIIILDEDDVSLNNGSLVANVLIANYGANLLTNLLLSNSDLSTGTIGYDSTLLSASMGPIDMVYDHRRKRIYVSNQKSNTVSCFLYSMNINEATIPVGLQPMGMALDQSRRLLYVVNNGDNNVSVINLGQGKVVSTIPVGSRPWGIAIDRIDIR
ncbi:MAG: beta-propeller fold lactonase family protein [bacterium]